MMDKDTVAVAKQLPVLLHVGKNGVSSAFVDELLLLIKKKKLVKVRFLKNFTDAHDTKSSAAGLAEENDLQIIHAIGNVVVFAKK